VGLHGQRTLRRDAEDRVRRTVTPVHVHRPRNVVHPGIAEAAQTEARARALVGALVGGRGDRRRDVVDRDQGAVVGVPAVLIQDPPTHGVGARTVGVAAAGRRARAGRGVGRAQLAARAVEGVVEAGAGVGSRRIERAAEADRRRAGLVYWAVIAKRGCSRVVVHDALPILVGVPAVLVEDPRAHGVGARAVGVAAAGRGGRAGGGVGRAQQAARAVEGVVEAGAGVGARGIERAAEADRSRATLVDRAVARERRRGRDVRDGDVEARAAGVKVLVGHGESHGVIAVV